MILLGVVWLALVLAWWARPLHRDRLEPRAVGYRLNVNAATADDLRALHGIGPALADRIVDHRETQGEFADPAALEAVSGIGPRTRARIEPWVRFD